jgi:hypothetical protein
MSDDLRTRIAKLVIEELERQAVDRMQYSLRYTPLDDEGNDLPELIGLDASIDPAAVADAVIRELDGVLVDWGLWLAEEITGRQMARIDLESCLTDWKADNE